MVAVIFWTAAEAVALVIVFLSTVVFSELLKQWWKDREAKREVRTFHGLI